MSNDNKLQTTQSEREEIEHLIDCHNGEFIDLEQVARLIHDAALAEQLQAKLDDPRGNICELCESYGDWRDCAGCRWNHHDKFVPIKEGR